MIWEKRQREIEVVELEALQRDLADRGLAYSGIRNRQEKELHEKFTAEINMARIRMESEEQNGSSWVPNGNWKPFILSVCTAILTSIIVSYISHYLPFLNADSTKNGAGSESVRPATAFATPNVAMV